MLVLWRWVLWGTRHQVLGGCFRIQVQKLGLIIL